MPNKPVQAPRETRAPEVYPLGCGAVTTGTRLGFSVPALPASIAAAVEAGGKVISPPQLSSWGHRAVLSDPEGHKVELLAQVQLAIPPDVPAWASPLQPRCRRT
jgi:hypothetical protein